MPLQIRESFVNLDRDIIFGESDWYEPFTDDVGQLFMSLQREYGRCASRMYSDPGARPCGWVFVKRDAYEDTGETYLRETWVHVRREETIVQ